MTLVNHETGEVIDLDVVGAERRAQQIETRLGAIGESFSSALQKIREAIAQRDDLALGYRSPSDYVSARFGKALSGLPFEMRREVIKELTEAGLSSRAIAPVVNVSDRMVRKDVHAIGGNRVPTSPTPEPAAGGEAVTGSGETPEGESEPARPTLSVAPRPPVIGIDGKRYQPPATKPAATTDDFTEQDRAEELAKNLSRNLSLLYAITNPERRAEYIATWRLGIRDMPPLGADFITPTHMRDLAAALHLFASEWETAHV